MKQEKELQRKTSGSH